MPKIRDPLRDPQQAQPTGYCPRCGGEYYGGEIGLCDSCNAELAPYDARTVDALLARLDEVLPLYLSKNYADEAYNKIAEKF